MSEPQGLHELGEGIDWPDADPVAAVRDRLTRPLDKEAARRAAQLGHLADLAEWVAGVRTTTDGPGFARIRLVVVGTTATDAVTDLAADAGIGIRVEAALPEGSAAAVAAGAAWADEEIDSGTDLFVVAVPGRSVESAIAISVLTNTEPSKVLARGIAATDPEAWMADVVAVRDARLRCLPSREDPDALLAGIGSSALAAAAGLYIRAAARRTPALIDGPAAAAAALVAYESHPRAVRWWRAADLGPDPSHDITLTRLGQTPVLGIGSGLGDGLAGLLAVPVLHAAARLAAP